MASTSASTCGGTERAVEGHAHVEASLVIHHQRRKPVGGIGRDWLGAGCVGRTGAGRAARARRSRACQPEAPRRPIGRTVTQNRPRGRSIVGAVRVGPDRHLVRPGAAARDDRKRRAGVRQRRARRRQHAQDRAPDDRNPTGWTPHPPNPIPLISIGWNRIQIAVAASRSTTMAQGTVARLGRSG